VWYAQHDGQTKGDAPLHFSGHIPRRTGYACPLTAVLDSSTMSMSGAPRAGLPHRGIPFSDLSTRPDQRGRGVMLAETAQ
jgi:hypothetical protein